MTKLIVLLPHVVAAAIFMALAIGDAKALGVPGLAVVAIHAALALRTPGRWPLALAAIPSVLVVSALLYFAETALECPGECSSYGEAMGAVVTASLIALVLSTIALLVREAWLLRRRTTVRDDRGP